MTSVFYHNPRCSKSRQALALLQTRGIAPEIVLYLDTPPDVGTLRTLLKQLGLPARAIIRTGEDAYATLGLDDPAVNEDTLIAAMSAHPRLIERPIFACGQRAVIGRPPERVLELC